MYSIEQLKKVILGDWKIANSKSLIDKILQDSRKLSKPESTLFFAIRGERLDGHNYIQQMLENGVRNFVVCSDEGLKDKLDVNYVVVKDSLEAMQRLTAYHREQFIIPVVAITGSNGKTIVKEWCHQLLQADFDICRSPKSYNSQLGVPLSVWGMNKKNTLALFEAGISEPDEMDNLQKIIKPNIGIFTTIGAPHSENFIHEGHKIKEKLKLFLKAEYLIYCADIPSLHQNIREAFGNNTQLSSVPELLSWGKNDEASIKILKEKKGLENTKIDLHYNALDYSFSIPFADSSSIQNAIHGIVLMLHLSYSEEQINERLLGLQRVAMRLEQKEGINNSTIINDCYNSDIDSLKIAMDFMQQQKYKTDKTVILSDILQSGMSGVDLYTAVNDLLVSNEVKRFIAIGPNLLQHQFVFKSEEFSVGLYFYPDTKSFIQSINDEDFGNETILLKGARKFEFELLSAALEEKAHATVLEIDLNAVVQNFKLFQSKLGSKTKVMAMVKAFSYGVSSVEIAKLLEFHRVDYLGVAYTDEGITLRKAGIETPIMVLNPEERSFGAIIKYRLEPEIYSFELLESFSLAVEKNAHVGPYPVHIDIDTGMKRLGFEPEQITELIAKLKSSESIEVKSIFSHLAASDEAALDEFTEEQIALFKQLSQDIMDGLDIDVIRHIANSSGIIRFPNAQMDMVRLGIGLYGFNEDLQNQIQTVARLKSTISQIKLVKKGESIGYGRKGKTTKDIVIATIAIGYADGLNRLLSNGVGEVVIRGQRAPIIGNVCMDMAMIDISSIPKAHVGDSVEIFGENISATEIAKKINTIPYEVLTAISERVKRVFFVD